MKQVSSRVPSYLSVVPSARRMGGVGAPSDTIFGIIGATKMSSESKSLGGLVETSTGVKSPKSFAPDRMMAKNTDQRLIGETKTPIAGSHYGQVPYAGQFYSKEGSKV